MKRHAVNKTLGVALSAFSVTAATVAQAQQVTGTLGSPGAATTISGRQLPPPDPKFGGVIKLAFNNGAGEGICRVRNNRIGGGKKIFPFES